MKATAWMGAGLLALPLQMAWANGERTVPDIPAAAAETSVPTPAQTPAHTPATSPINEPEATTAAPAQPVQPVQPVRLRDSLRQSADNGSEPFQPYRLSLEERQRMREQLRHHGTIEFRIKP